MTTAVETAPRDATADDARDLLAAYKLLADGRKAVSKAVKAIDDAWIDTDLDVTVLRSDRDKAIAAFDADLDTVWEGLKTMPKNTVAPGGMTRQTVGLEFFNKNLNRDGKARLTAAQARKLNAAAIALA